MNISVCNYFIINILKFYNLTLLYIFLKINLLPSFVRMFFVNLAYIFFTRGSIQQFMGKILKDNGTIDFSFLDLQ